MVKSMNNPEHFTKLIEALEEELRDVYNRFRHKLISYEKALTLLPPNHSEVKPVFTAEEQSQWVRLNYFKQLVNTKGITNLHQTATLNCLLEEIDLPRHKPHFQICNSIEEF